MGSLLLSRQRPFRRETPYVDAYKLIESFLPFTVTFLYLEILYFAEALFDIALHATKIISKSLISPGPRANHGFLIKNHGCL